MAKENRFSLTKISLTPKSCKVVCIVFTLLLLVAMVGAAEINLRGDSGHGGGHSHRGDSDHSDGSDSDSREQGTSGSGKEEVESSSSVESIDVPMTAGLMQMPHSMEIL